MEATTSSDNSCSYTTWTKSRRTPDTLPRHVRCTGTSSSKWPSSTRFSSSTRIYTRCCRFKREGSAYMESILRQSLMRARALAYLRETPWVAIRGQCLSEDSTVRALNIRDCLQRWRVQEKTKKVSLIWQTTCLRRQRRTCHSWDKSLACSKSISRNNFRWPTVAITSSLTRINSLLRLTAAGMMIKMTS